MVTNTFKQTLTVQSQQKKHIPEKCIQSWQ